ncbi:MAG: hypothetical protein KGM98_07185 [Bacteroidota bacterium]|nr:hypothetical protein [Bacteroidota bacterium]
MPKKCVLFSCFLLLFLHFDAKVSAQKSPDSLRVTRKVHVSRDSAITGSEIDSSIIRRFNPHKAALKSAIFPGWGQFYNKKYWKIPIVWGGLGIAGYAFFFNLKTYRQLRTAVILLSDTIRSNDSLVDPRFRILGVNSLRTYRNEYRQNIDYSVLAFLIIWGLNVVDATVDAHLKAFDISPSLTMKITPSLNGPYNGPGLSLTFSLKDRKDRPLLPLP